MVTAKEISEQIREQEETGFFKSLRKRKGEKKELTYERCVQAAPLFVKDAIKRTGEFKILERYPRIIFAGTGIDGLACRILRDYLAGYGHRIGLERGFSLPEDVNNETLVFICSYSGGDKEALSCYRMALRKGCRIIGISAAEGMIDQFSRNSTEHIPLPSPQKIPVGFWYIFFVILRIFENSRMIPDLKSQVEESIQALGKKEVSGMAEGLYPKLQDKIPIVHSTKSLAPVAEYWKHIICSLACSPCFYSVLSFAATELDLFSKDAWDLYSVFISEPEEDPQIRKSMAMAKEVIGNQGYGTTEIMIKGANRLTRLCSAVQIANQEALLLRSYYSTEPALYSKYKTKQKETI